MDVLWQVGHVAAVLLGLVYLARPERVHTFGFESLRRSSADRSGGSSPPIWRYRGVGVLLMFIGTTGFL